jgi:hypothetical protein
MLAAIVARLIRAYLSLYRALSGHHLQSARNKPIRPRQGAIR